MNLIKALGAFVLESLRALAHPEDPQAWRFAWAVFVFPLVVFSFGVAVSVGLAVLLPRGWDWVAIFVWLYYIWFGEPYMFYIDPGEGFNKQMHWVEHGGE